MYFVRLRFLRRSRSLVRGILIALLILIAIPVIVHTLTAMRIGQTAAPIVYAQEAPPLICVTATPTDTPPPPPTDTPTPTFTPYVPPPTPSTPTATPTPCPGGGPASLVGFVFYDLNGDGVRQRNLEPGIGGVTIHLSNGRSKTSNTPSGFWGFLVPAGTYTVWMDVPEGYQATTATSYTWTLASCEFNDRSSFGLRILPPTATFTPTPQNTPTPVLICVTATATPTPTWTNTPTATSVPTNTPTPTATKALPTFTPTPSPTAAATPPVVPTNTPTATPSPTFTSTPTPVKPPPTATKTPPGTPPPIGEATATPTPEVTPPPVIPEPTTLALLSSGLAGLGAFAAWRRRR